MKRKFAKITKNEIEKYLLPFIPKNKHGFASKVDWVWEYLFVDIQNVNPQFSRQLVYYYYKNGEIAAFLSDE